MTVQTHWRNAYTVYSLLKQRDGSVCILCGYPIENGEESVDHIVQRALGGSHEASNLRLVHLKCNQHRPRKLGRPPMTTQATHPGSTRKEFLKILAHLKDSESLNIASVARSLGVTDGLLSRYMREARRAGWVETRKTWWGTVITVLDRAGLEKASGPAIDR